MLQIFSKMRGLWEILVMIILSVCFKTIDAMPYHPYYDYSHRECLSWRVAVEANNIRGWRTVPNECLRYVEYYMLYGQYQTDLEVIIEQIFGYIDDLVLSNCSGANASWILDVDDTCISNLPYYQGKQFGGDPYDPMQFKAWAMRGDCPAIPAVLKLFNKLISSGFRVFLLTGRDEETMGKSTTENLHIQGFVGYEKLILRPSTYRGQSAVKFKSVMRMQLQEQGYRIWGNVGDQWSDLAGDCLGERTFKLPNPMYYVP